MQRLTPELPIRRLGRCLGLFALCSASLTGCANTCFLVISNPPNGTISVVAGNPPPACTLAKSKGAIRVVAHANSVCPFCSESNRIQSVLLNLKGIDIHSRANSVHESSDWQELFPRLENQPLQVDLPTEGKNLPRYVTDRVLVPTGTYDLLRFRFEPNQSGDDIFQARNACSRIGSSCVVMANGQIVPLVFDADSLESRLTAESTADGLLFVSPGSDSELLIELTPVMSIGAFLGNGARGFSLVASGTRIPSQESDPVELKATALDFSEAMERASTSNP
jgi:hypothetical protein